MRLPSSEAFRREPLEVKMTPMIDVVFLLLIFFVWTASFQIEEKLLPSGWVAIPTGATASPLADPMDFDAEILVIRILWENDTAAWTLNGAIQNSLDDMQATLRAVSQIRSDLPVIIDPAAVVPLGHVIDVYDRTRLAGLEHIQFAAEESP